jgi:hypothetical protein
VWVPGSIDSLAGSFAADLLTINLGLAAFNLIPAFPMDGGRVLRAALSGWLGRTRATEVAAHLGQALAIIFGVYSLSRGSIVQAALAAFVFMAARMELAQVLAEERRRQTPHQSQNLGEGIWVAPPGYGWVNRGQGVWQLVPIGVHVSDQAQSWG